MHHHVDGGGDLRAQRAEREIDAAQQRAGLDAREALARAVGVDGRHASRVAGVQSLQEVERLAAADFADDQAVGAQAQRRMEQIADRHFALVVLVRPAGLKANRVFLLDLQLAGVFDHQDALVLGDEGAEHVQHRGFPRGGGAGNDDVLVEFREGVEQLPSVGGGAAAGDQLGDGDLFPLEFTDGDDRAAAGERRNHHVDARAVGQPGVEARALLGQLAAHALGDVDGGGPEGLLADKAGVSGLQPALLFDVDLIGPVDQDFRNVIILEKLTDRLKEEFKV